uniref:Sushi domain-containing protein n=1 Tax=Loxodonta africana TaxID=9785 RepID=G3SME8_LOXAF
MGSSNMLFLINVLLTLWVSCAEGQGKCFFPSVENGHSSSSGQIHLEGDTVQILCDTGYKLANDQSSITCMEDDWSSPPKCSTADSGGKCGPPPPIENGDIISFPLPTYTQGSTVEYQCWVFYELKGDKHITCRNGQWSEPPKCLDISCGNPPEVKNANIISEQKTRYPPGERVRYECNKPYSLYGEVEVMCLRGTWTEPPECKG